MGERVEGSGDKEAELTKFSIYSQVEHSDCKCHTKQIHVCQLCKCTDNAPRCGLAFEAFVSGHQSQWFVLLK